MTAYSAIASSEDDAESPISETYVGKLKNNPIAMFEKASGAPVLADNYVVEAMMDAASVNQAALKTTTGTVSVTGTTSTLILPGGEYGFYPNTWKNNAGNPATASLSVYSTSQTCSISLGAGGGYVTYALQRYIQASPPYNLGNGDIPLFIFVVIDNATGKVIATYIAEDPPWANNGPTNIRPDFIGPTGKKMKRVKATIAEFGNIEEAKRQLGLDTPDKMQTLYNRLVNDKYVDVEITQALKQADMPLIPHPFMGNDLTGKTVVLIDPLGTLTHALQPIVHNDGVAEIARIIQDGYIRIGNTDNGASAPPGVMPVAASFK